MEPQDLGLLLIAVGISEFPLMLLIGMRYPRANRVTLFLAALFASGITISVGVLFLLRKLG